MIRREILHALMATPLTHWLRPWMAPASDGAASDGPDAAIVYRKTFGWVQALRPEDQETLRTASTIAIDDPQVEALIRKAGPVLGAIREAASLARCDWGIKAVSPEVIGEGHLDVSNSLVIRVACLSARRLAKSGRGREALDDVFAGLTMAHRIGTGGPLIARLLECGGEVSAFQALGRILPVLDRPTLDDLARRLEALPPPDPASATIGPESRFILGSLRAKLAMSGALIEGARWTELGFDPDEAATLRRLTGGDRDKLLAHLDATGPAFDELARRLDLPRPGCRASLDEFAQAAMATQPIAAGLTEQARGVRHMVDRMRALRAMLHGGIVLVRDGEPAFRKVPDPFGAGAFGLEHRGAGYRIRSMMSDEEKPEVALEIGDAA